MLTLVTVAVAAGGVELVRARVSSRARTVVAARLRPGPSGVIAGAEPFERVAGADRAVLVLHGFGDTPQTLHYLADRLHAHGWTVRVPLLPGHGRTLGAFAASRADQWLGHARAELESLRAEYSHVAVIGLSMGGALATILAAETREVAALVLLAPYLSMPTRLRRAARLHSLLGLFVPFFRGGGERSIRDPSEAAKNLAYGFTTPRLVYELSRVVRWSRAAAPAVAAPMLVIQSRQDNRIPPDAAERAFALFAAADRQMIWTEGNGHVISVDYGHRQIAESIVEWLASRDGVARPRATGAPGDAQSIV